MTETTQPHGGRPDRAVVLIGGRCPVEVRHMLAASSTEVVYASSGREFTQLSIRPGIRLCIYFAGRWDHDDRLPADGRRTTDHVSLLIPRRTHDVDDRVFVVCPVDGDHDLVGRVIAAVAPPVPPGPTGTLDKPLDRLSSREREALVLISAGYTHEQAARRMGVRKATVDTFVARIRTKLGPGNKAHLTRAALSTFSEHR